MANGLQMEDLCQELVSYPTCILTTAGENVLKKSRTFSLENVFRKTF